MVDSQENTGDLFNGWILAEKKVCIKIADTIHNLSAADIVRVEFKDISTVNGVPVNLKPSKALPSIHFNRFPCELKILLKIPSDSLNRPIVELSAISYGQSYSIQEFPESDQIIINQMEWFPLLDDNIKEIQDVLQVSRISEFGIISLRQTLDLIKSGSSLVSFCSVVAGPDNSDQVNLSCDRALNLLADHGFKATLYPYQKNGFSWLKSISEEGLGCILADEMGLGKTLQIIAVLSYFKIKWGQPSLIIAPATLLENWRREFARFSPKMSVHVHSGNDRTGFPSQLKKYDIVISSYETVVRDQGLLAMVEWAFVVLDEAQAIKNQETRRAIAAKGLKRNVGIAVTGTPIENRLVDLWSIMDFSCPGFLGTREDFDRNYSDNQESAENLEVIISPLILRRRVADVATDLPEKIIIPQPVNMDDKEGSNYECIRKKVADEYGKSASLISLLRLRQYCTHPLLVEENVGVSEISLLKSSKYRRLIEIIDEIVLNQEKVIVFTSFIMMSDILLSDIPIRFNIPAWQIDGRTPVENRQKLVDQFSEVNGPAILILNPKAAGTGLNITAANHVIHYTLEWNPAIEDQATARAFRRGQTLPVTVHRLFYPNTVEDVINDRLERKRLLAETAVVGTEATEVEAADIARAINLSPNLSPQGENK